VREPGGGASQKGRQIRTAMRGTMPADVEEVPPCLSNQPSEVTGTEPVDLRDFLSTLDADAGVHTTRARPPARAPRGWPPGAGRTVARPRNCGSWWATTWLQRPPTRLDVSCRVAAQVSDTGPKFFL